MTCSAAWAGAPPCESLARIDLAGLPDAPTSITKVEQVSPRENTTGAYCQVQGYVHPNVGFVMRLPVDHWNEKFLQQGCGGFCGSTTHISGCDDPLRRGYACIVSNNGHNGSSLDAVWAYNNLSAEIDHAFRATHVTALAGKAIVERYYGRAPRYSYYWGGSTGGRLALLEAQRFPWDFDGIIAGVPSLRPVLLHMGLLWGHRALHAGGQVPILEQSDLDLLHEAVVQRCDLNDGIKDGLIGDPRHCTFDPAILRCTAGKTSECLTSAQLRAVEQIYGGPVTSRGEQIHFPGALRGSERSWLDWFGRMFSDNPQRIYRFVQDEFRYAGFDPDPGPGWKPEDFDFDRDYKRIGVAESLYNAGNPDLRRFRDAGGKLIAYHGWNDAGGMPLPTIDYYEMVERVFGSREATQEFFRLFVVPGMNHGPNEVDGSFETDWLTYLEDWVEEGQAPGPVINHHVKAAQGDAPRIEFSRAIHPYPQPSERPDARAGLKAGVKDAGQAAWHMTLISNTPPPPGFRAPYYDGPGPTPEPAALFDFAATDLAFQGTRLFQGNFQGFNVFDVADPANVKLLVSVVCPPGGGDLAVHGNLLFLSTEPPTGRLDCGAGGSMEDVDPARFRGVRIFDISSLTQPRQVAAIQTCKGSHTVTLMPDRGNPRILYVYNETTGMVRSSEDLAGCVADPEDPNTALFSIDVIKVPLDAPEKAEIVNQPRLMKDHATGKLNSLAAGGERPGQITSSGTRNCHDIMVYPDIGLAAASCYGNGLLLDISDPADPRRLDAVTDPNMGYWHSAIFNNKGDAVVFADEWGAGKAPHCRPSDPKLWGGNATFTVANGKLVHQGYFKIPNTQGSTENCMAHYGNLIPIPGRDVMVQSWYQGGISVVDFSDPVQPFEIAYFDRGPLSDRELLIGGHWSAYWYNGLIYGSEIARGLDILRLEPSDLLSRNEIAAATLIQDAQLNPQTQTRIVWPDEPVVAEAYLDQLARDKALPPARIAAARRALAAQGSKAAIALAARLDKQAAVAQGRTAERLTGVARVLRAKQ